jgi:hypothetical protein
MLLQIRVVESLSLIWHLCCSNKTTTPSYKNQIKIIKIGDNKMKEMFYYATSVEHIRFAARNGIKNVIVDSRGHGADRAGSGLKDDQLCLMPKYKKIYNIRKNFKKEIDLEITNAVKRIETAKKHGLKPYMHSYEISFPIEIKECYPELFVKQVEEARKIDPTCDVDRYLCLEDERVRDMISDKIEEILSNLPGIEGYIYSFHESQLTTFNHFCDNCKKLPRHKLIEWLYEAVKKGAERINPGIKIMPRLWGITHPLGLFYKNHKKIAKIIEYDQTKWICRRLPVIKKYHFVPEKVNPRIGKIIAKDNDALIYKATWGDYSLYQPYNKWACSYAPSKQIVELSFEHCVLGKNIPLIISKQHQDMIKKMQDRNVTFCAVPVNWGRVYKKDDEYRMGADPAKWGLNFLNAHNVVKLMKNPNISLPLETKKAIEENYKEEISQKFAKMLLGTADVLDGAVNINGVSTIMNLDYLLCKPSYNLMHVLSNTLWYKCMRKDGDKRISTADKNMKKIFLEKDKAIEKAEKLFQTALLEIAEFKNTQLIKDANEFFRNFKDLTEFIAVSRKRLWIQLKAQKEHKISLRWTSLLDELLEQEKVLVAKSKLLQGIYDGTFSRIF